MKIGIYGGSFNPIHYGHIGLARWVREHTSLDEVWLMVSPNNPLKAADSLAPEEERYAEVVEALRGQEGLRACRFEFDLPRPNYTVQTLRALQHAYPEHEFTLLMGEDNLRLLNRWRDWQYLVSTCPIMVYPRHTADGEPAALPDEVTQALASAKRVEILHGAPYFDISSTAIRAGRASAQQAAKDKK